MNQRPAPTRTRFSLGLGADLVNASSIDLNIRHNTVSIVTVDGQVRRSHATSKVYSDPVYSVPLEEGFSLLGWAQDDDLGTGYIVMASPAALTNHAILYGNSGNNKWIFRTREAAGSTDLLETGTHTTSAFDFLVGTNDGVGGPMILYKNGSLNNSNGGGRVLTDVTRGPVVGGRQGGSPSSSFIGDTGPCAIYNRILTGDEVSALFTLGVTHDLRTNSGNYQASSALTHYYDVAMSKTKTIKSSGGIVVNGIEVTNTTDAAGHVQFEDIDGTVYLDFEVPANQTVTSKIPWLAPNGLVANSPDYDLLSISVFHSNPAGSV